MLALCLIGCSGRVVEQSSERAIMPWQSQAPAGQGCLPGAAGCQAPPPAVCAGAACRCAPGLFACAGLCVDLASNQVHCGGCDQACSAGATCTQGQCICPLGTLDCGAGCTSASSDVLHCGACGHACAPGETCEQGSCRAMVAADGCAQGCAIGASCQNDQCVCPQGQAPCAGACVDTATNVDHCGGCAQACGPQEACVTGACQASAGDDGCGGPARALSITQIAAYQAIKVPVMQNGAAISQALRVTDVVAGRDALFRVFVAPEAGFTARELSARLTFTDGSGTLQYYDKRILSQSSTDAAVASTFQIAVPGEALAPDTRYSVEVVECGSFAGSSVAPRFPVSGDEALLARTVGVLKVAFVPVSTSSRLPDTSQAALDVYRDYLMAMYPVSDVQVSVTTSISTGNPVDWVGLLRQIASKRESDRPAGDVYYYGLVKPSTHSTANAYCAAAGSCTAGIGYVGNPRDPGSRAAVGLAYVDETSASAMAHEIGHNHGRAHAPCAPRGLTISDVDPGYPYPGALVDVWGYDARTEVLLDPSVTTDIMGYCDRQWISDYTYNGLIDHVVGVGGSFRTFGASQLIAAYRVVLVEASEPRWSIPFAAPAEPYGEAELAEVLAADGHVLETITVYRTRVGDMDASTVLVPEPEASWAAVRLAGSPALAFEAK